MFEQDQYKPLRKVDVIYAIQGIRHEWETNAKGDSLVEINGSVGLLLYDLCKALEFGQQAMETALGADLVEEVEKEISSPIS